MFAHEFFRNAFLAGTAIALASGLIGYFVVLRAQVFAGDALSHVAFTGAVAAAAAGIDVRIGLFAATIAIALLLGLLGDRSHPDDVEIGIVFAAILWLGLVLSYQIPTLPPSSAIVAVATGIYLLAFLATTDLRRLAPTLIRGNET